MFTIFAWTPCGSGSAKKKNKENNFQQKSRKSLLSAANRRAIMPGDLTCKVYVGDIPRDTTEYELEREFEKFGKLRNVWVARQPPGFAFVEYEDPRDADDAVHELDGREVFGTRIRVEHSTGKVRPKPWLRGRGGRREDEKCYECGRYGHYRSECRSGGGGGRRRSRSRDRRSRSRDYRRSRSRSRSRDRRSRSDSGDRRRR